MSKIKILHYCNSLDFSEESLTMERYVKHLDKRMFENYVIYNSISENPQLKNFVNILGEQNVRGIKMINCTLQWNTPVEHNLFDVLNSFISDLKIEFDIFHVYRKGNPEFPLIGQTKKYFKRIVETNFEGSDDHVFHPDISLCVSQFVLNKKNIKSNSEVLYNGVEKTKAETNNLKSEFGLSERFIFGYIGEQGSFTDISLLAFKKFTIEVYDNNAVYLIVNPCERTRECVKDNKILNVILHDHITDENWLDGFYNSIDVFAHYSRDGERCGYYIQKAMISAKPVISHVSEEYNGHLEIIDNHGLIAKPSTVDNYYGIMKLLYRNEELRKSMGTQSKAWAMKTFEIKNTIKRLENIYFNLLK